MEKQDDEVAVGRQVLTIPNIISIIRLAGVPLFLWLILGARGRRVGAGRPVRVGLHRRDATGGGDEARRIATSSGLATVPVSNTRLFIGVAGMLASGIARRIFRQPS